ncbi:MAG: ABC transporter substrate-binding protein [Deltaproteobacteria bacterium]|nr:ABC transporter substrate-binding protein [Deltaproteobacteria bacterium]
MKKIAFVICILSLPCWAVSLRWAQGQTKLNVIYPAISGVSNALWVAAEANTFAKYGLEITLLYIPSAPQVVRVMLAGDSPISFTGGAPVVNANLGGADLVFIGGVANMPAFYLMATSDIKSIEDLKGKTVGVTRFGSSTDFTMRYVLQKHGLQPDKDVTLLQIGGMPELAAAISKRLILAAPFSSPTNLRAKKAGAHVLIDMAKAGIAFPHQNIAVIRKYTRDQDEEILETTYQYGLDYIARPPYPTREGIVETLKQTAHPKAKTANPDDFVDMSLVKGLEDSGFFKQIGLQK